MSENNQEWKLPKNVRQVGEGSGEKKIYVEDYVITYLNHLVEKEMPGKAILLGEVREAHQCSYIFAQGAVEVESFYMEENVRDEVREKIQKHFGNKQVVGWFWPSEESPFVMKKEILEIFEREFPGDDQILLVKDIQEEENTVFLMEEGMAAEQPGYYIYYDKNAAMQEYMLAENAGKTVDDQAKVKDDAIRNFRKIIKSKKIHLAKPEFKVAKAARFASGFLAMTVLALGITVIYNYDRMKAVEKSLTRLTGNVESQMEYVTDDFGDAAPVMVHIEESETEKTESNSESEAETNGETTLDTEKEGSSEAIVESDTEETAGVSASAPRASYLVKVGDTLADISKMYYGDLSMVSEICKLNGITDENTILPGQKILLP